MKRLIFLVLAAGIISRAEAASTIDAANHYAYGANLGWLNGRGDTNNGAVIGEYVCSGYIYSANVGWINLGNGSPTNQIQYQNNSATDFWREPGRSWQSARLRPWSQYRVDQF